MAAISQALKDLFDEFVGVKRRTGTRLVFLAEPVLRDIAGAADVTLRLSDSGFTTGAGGTPAHTNWLPRFVLPDFNASLGFGDGVVGHAGQINVSQIELLNLDSWFEGKVPGQTINYLDDTLFVWHGGAFTILAGGDTWDRAIFEPLVTAKIAHIEADRDVVRVTLEPTLTRLKRPFHEVVYKGLASELSFNGTTTKVEIGDEYNPGAGDFTCEFMAKFPTGGLRALIVKRNSLNTAADNGISLWITAADQVRGSVSDGTTQYTAIFGAAGDFDDDVRRRFSLVIDTATNELRSYVDGVLKNTVDTSSPALGKILNSDPLHFGRMSNSAANFYDAELDDVRFWSRARTVGQIKAQKDHSLRGFVDGLIGLFKFDEYGLIGGGAVTLQEVVGPTLRSRIADAAGDEIDFGNNHDQTTADFAWGWWFKCTSGGSGDRWIFGKRNDLATASAGWGMHVNGSGNLVVQLSDGTDLGTETITVHDFADGRWYVAVVSVDQTADTMTVHYRTAGESWAATTPLSISAVDSLTNGVNLRALRAGAGGVNMPGQVSHGFVLPQKVTQTEARDGADFSWFPLSGLQKVEGDNTGQEEPTPSPTVTGTLKKVSGASFWAVDETSGSTVTDKITATGIDGTVTAGTLIVDRDGDVTAGTWVTTLEGSEEFAGLPKPLSLGRVKDVPGVPVEMLGDRFYQVGTPEVSALEEVEAARADGLLMATPADYTINLTDCDIDVNDAINKESVIHLDVKGQKNPAGDFMRYTGEIAEWVVETRLAGTLEAGTAAALDDLYPYEVGLFLGPRQFTTEEIMDALFQKGEQPGERGRLFWAELFGGTIRFGALRDVSAETAVLSLTQDHISVEPDGLVKQAMRPPAWKLLLGFQRVWVELTDLLAAVTVKEQRRLSNRYRWIRESDEAVRTDYKDARQLRLPTLIYRATDAQREAAIMFPILNKERPVYIVKTLRGFFQVEIGDVVQVTEPRLGLDSGRKFICIGYAYSVGGVDQYPQASLELWGGF